MVNNRKILSDYLLSKVEDILSLDHENGKYVREQQVFEKDKNVICNVSLPIRIDDKILLDYSDQSAEILKKDGYKRYTRFNPIKYKSHLSLLEDALVEYGKSVDADLESVSVKAGKRYFGKVFVTFSDGNQEVFAELDDSYKTENEALLKVILETITDYDHRVDENFS